MKGVPRFRPGELAKRVREALAPQLPWTLLACAPGLALANPTGGNVVAGSATITSLDPNTTRIDQASAQAIINWQSFSIGSQQYVQFRQPDSTSLALNRVVGGSPSSILGRLSANGQVFLVNTRGVYFGPGAQVDVGGMVASIHDISNADFLSRNYRFSKSRDAPEGASVVNDGTIRSAEGGYVILAGGEIVNNGFIEARLGSVVLASGASVTLDLEGDGLISFAVDQAALSQAAGVKNTGQLLADGGRVLMSARVAADLMRTVVNNEGLVQARSVQESPGGVFILAGGGDIEHSGTVDASGMNGADGGRVHIAGNQNITLAPDSEIHAGGLNAGGSVRVIAEENLRFEEGAHISATAEDPAGTGGFVEVSGHGGLTLRGQVDLGQGGRLAIDPEKLIITTGSAAPNSTFSSTGTGSSSSSPSGTTNNTVGKGFIETQLKAGTSVVLVANGDITCDTGAGNCTTGVMTIDGRNAGAGGGLEVKVGTVGSSDTGSLGPSIGSPQCGSFGVCSADPSGNLKFTSGSSGDIRLSAVNIQIDGNFVALAGNGDVSVGQVTAGGNVAVSASDDIVLQGVSAQTGIALNAIGASNASVTVNGSLVTTAGNVQVQAGSNGTESGWLTVAGNVSAGGAVTLNAQGSIEGVVSISGSVNAGAGVGISASTDVDTGPINAGANVSVVSGNDINLGPIDTASSSVKISGGGDVTLGGVTLTSSGTGVSKIIRIDVDAGGTLDVNGPLTVNTTRPGDSAFIDLDAVGAATLDARLLAQATQGRGRVDVNGNGITVNASIEAVGGGRSATRVQINAGTGDFVFNNGNILALGQGLDTGESPVAFGVSAGGAVVFPDFAIWGAEPRVQITGKNVLLNAPFQPDGANPRGVNGLILAVGSESPDVWITANGLTSGDGRITMTGPMVAAMGSIDSDSSLEVSFTAKGKVTIAAPTTAVVDPLTSAVRKIAVLASAQGGSSCCTNEINVRGGRVEVQAGALLVSRASTSDSVEASINIRASDQGVPQPLGFDVVMDGALEVVVGGSATDSAQVWINAIHGSVFVNGPISATAVLDGATVDISARDGVTINGPITVTGGTPTFADAQIRIDVTAGDLTVGAGGALTAIARGDNANIWLGRTNPPPLNMNVGGALVATAGPNGFASVYARAGSDLTIGNTVNATGPAAVVNFTAGNDLTVNGAVVATANASGGGTVLGISGFGSAGDPVTIGAAYIYPQRVGRHVTINAPMTANANVPDGDGEIEINAVGGDVLVTQALTVNVGSGTAADADIQFANILGNVTVDGALNLTVGNVGAGESSWEFSFDTIGGDLTLNGPMTLRAGRALTGSDNDVEIDIEDIGGHVTVNSTVLIEAGNNLDAQMEFDRIGGTVTVTSGNIFGGSAVFAFAPGGTADLALNGPVTITVNSNPAFANGDSDAQVDINGVLGNVSVGGRMAFTAGSGGGTAEFDIGGGGASSFGVAGNASFTGDLVMRARSGGGASLDVDNVAGNVSVSGLLDFAIAAGPTAAGTGDGIRFNLDQVGGNVMVTGQTLIVAPAGTAALAKFDFNSVGGDVSVSNPINFNVGAGIDSRVSVHDVGGGVTIGAISMVAGTGAGTTAGLDIGRIGKNVVVGDVIIGAGGAAVATIHNVGGVQTITNSIYNKTAVFAFADGGCGAPCGGVTAGAITNPGGAVTVTGFSGVTLGQVVSGANVSVAAASGSVTTGPVNAGGNVVVTAGSDISLGPIVAASSLVKISGGGDVTLGGVSLTSNGTAAPTNGIILIDVDAGGNLLANGALTVNALSFSPWIELDAGGSGSVTVNASVEAVGMGSGLDALVDIQTSSGSISVNAGASVKASGDSNVWVTIQAQGEGTGVTIDGPVLAVDTGSAGANAALLSIGASSGSVLVNAALTAQSLVGGSASVYVAAVGSDMTLNAPVKALAEAGSGAQILIGVDGDLTVGANASLTALDGPGGGVIGIGGGGLESSGSPAGGAVFGALNATAGVFSLDVPGGFDAVNLLSTVNGILNTDISASNFTFQTGGNLDVQNRTISATGPAQLMAGGNALLSGANISASTLLVSAGGNIQNIAATTLSANGMTLAAQGDVLLGATTLSVGGGAAPGTVTDPILAAVMADEGLGALPAAPNGSFNAGGQLDLGTLDLQSVPSSYLVFQGSSIALGGVINAPSDVTAQFFHPSPSATIGVEAGGGLCGGVACGLSLSNASHFSKFPGTTVVVGDALQTGSIYVDPVNMGSQNAVFMAAGGTQNVIGYDSVTQVAQVEDVGGLGPVTTGGRVLVVDPVFGGSIFEIPQNEEGEDDGEDEDKKDEVVEDEEKKGEEDTSIVKKTGGGAMCS